MAAIDGMVGGPVAIAFVNGEVSAVAKALRDFAKENTALKLMGAVVDGKAVDAKGVKALADLPSREVMLAKFAGLLKAPMSNTAYLLSALPRKAAYGLKALVEQKQAA
jgi:large subunit ribosomal protein L10